MLFFILFHGTDRREQIDLLVELESNKHNLGPALQLKISCCIVAALFDFSMKVHEVQKVQYWLRLFTKAGHHQGEYCLREHSETYFHYKLIVDHNVNFEILFCFV